MVLSTGVTPGLPTQAERPFVEALQELLQSRLGVLFGLDPDVVRIVDDREQGTISLEIDVPDEWQPEIEPVMIQTLRDVGCVLG